MARSAYPVSPGAAAWLAIIVIPLVYYFGILCKKRGQIRKMINLGKPVPPHSFLFGHLLEVKNAFDSLPPHAHNIYALAKVGAPFAEHGAYYLDTWPLFDPMLVVNDPKMADQFVFHPFTGARKPNALKNWMREITGGPSMFDSNGESWKRLHDLVAPCFSAANINAEMPTIVENILVFQDILRQKAHSGERFRLEALCKNLVIDNVGNLVLHSHLNVQRRPHPLAEAMIHQLKIKTTSHNTDEFFGDYMPRALYESWQTSRKLDRHIRDFLTTRFAELRATGGKDGGADDDAGGFKCIMDQLLLDYAARHPARAALDAEFLAAGVANMRMLFFVSYDSSAAAIAYCLHNLARSPAALAAARAEHDAVFGPDPSAAPAAIAASPALLNALPYTSAVIRESMRMFPPAGGIRQGSRDLVLVNDRGETFPTDGFSVQVGHWVVQNSPRSWPRPRDFVPERFLVGPEHELYPPKGAWRAFEFGPRACLGQQLVMTELRAVLACVVREFDFAESSDEVFGVRSADLSGVGGEKVYMVEAGSSHPLGEYPCRVTLSRYGVGSRY